MDKVYEKVLQHPSFHELRRRRNRFALTLSAIVLVVYYTFVWMAATQPALFSSPVSEGLTWCVGLAAGFLIQAFAFVMTGIYVARANGEFDALNRTLIMETGR